LPLLSLDQTECLIKLYCKQKTLFIRGEKSDYILDSEVENLGKYFTDFQLMSISNAGHWVQAENPVEFQEKTLFFLKS
jgi:pimeloyl-ACP methyl ester carboxylesterase